MKEKSRSRFELFRSMSEDELVSKFGKFICKQVVASGKKCAGSNCRQCCKDWLNEEVGEEDASI